MGPASVFTKTEEKIIHIEIKAHKEDKLKKSYEKKYFCIKAAQRHRDYYRGYPKAYHPLTYFLDRNYKYQCPSEMTETYLTFPMYHVKYKQPSVLPNTTGRTSVMPALPSRTLAGRYNKASCKAFVR